MAHTDLTTAELVGLLQRTKLPTVITEGGDDVVAFRRLEEKLSALSVSILPAGGRPKVMELLERRTEFIETPVAFIVDRDLLVFEPTLPPPFNSGELCLTDGYSIENDLYRDGELEILMTADERSRFNAEREQICQWYAAAVNAARGGILVDLSTSPHALLDAAGRLRPQYAALHPTCQKLESEIDADYQRLLRGKTLVATLLRQLSRSGRKAKFSRFALIELAAAREGPLFNRIAQFVQNALT